VQDRLNQQDQNVRFRVARAQQHDGRYRLKAGPCRSARAPRLHRAVLSHPDCERLRPTASWSRHLLADAVAVARSVLLDIDMQMVVMGRVRARAEDGREPAAGSRSHTRERRIRRSTGLRLDQQS
jgi:hypothetical protein